VRDDLAALASEAYIYGFALVFDLQQVGRFTREGMGSLSRQRPPTASATHRSWPARTTVRID
jgi:hypothetical protein